MNNYHTRLKAYKKALRLYRIDRVKSWFGLSRLYYTRSGLCLYFDMEEGERLANYPGLIKQRPTGVDNSEFWFPQGAMSPRIKVLKAAIKLTKRLMKGV